MPSAGKFTVPKFSHQSTQGARDAFEKWTGDKWPGDDKYLRELANEAHTCNHLLDLMRECAPIAENVRDENLAPKHP